MEPRHTNSRVHQFDFERTIIASSGAQKNEGQQRYLTPRPFLLNRPESL
jgi:hypothetical protein